MVTEPRTIMCSLKRSIRIVPVKKNMSYSHLHKQLVEAVARSGSSWPRPITPDMNRGFSWDAGAPSASSWDDGVEQAGDDDLEQGEPNPSEEFVSLLTDMYLSGKMHAKAVCVLSFWAAKAGVEAAKPFALHPQAATGHYQRKLDTALGMPNTDANSYQLEVPGHNRRDATRTAHTITTRPCHESIAREINARPAILQEWSAQMEGTWVEAYEKHSVVQSAPREERERILPLAIYMDATPFTTTDSFIGIFVYLLSTGTRHLTVLLRKSDMCVCGCKGWCTLYPVYVKLAWSLGALAKGRMPSERHDGSAWRESDATRALTSGEPLGFRAVVVDIKGDWAEFAQRFGFPSWGAVLAPCMFCTVLFGNHEHSDLWRLGLAMPPRRRV